MLAALEHAGTVHPTTTAATLHGLCDAYGPALALVAPGGTSAFASVPHAADLVLALLEHTASSARVLTTCGETGAALTTALEGLALASHLRFGSHPAAEPFYAAALLLRRAATAAADAGAPALESDALAAWATCARADRRLQLAPWLGYAWADGVDGLLAAGWSDGEVAVQAAERWCALVAAHVLHPSPAHFTRLAEAALGHERLSPAQLDRLLAAEAALPADMTSGMNAWLAAWQVRVAECRAAAVAAAAAAAAMPALKLAHTALACEAAAE